MDEERLCQTRTHQSDREAPLVSCPGIKIYNYECPCFREYAHASCSPHRPLVPRSRGKGVASQERQFPLTPLRHRPAGTERSRLLARRAEQLRRPAPEIERGDRRQMAEALPDDTAPPPCSPHWMSPVAKCLPSASLAIGARNSSRSCATSMPTSYNLSMCIRSSTTTPPTNIPRSGLGWQNARETTSITPQPTPRGSIRLNAGSGS